MAYSSVRATLGGSDVKKTSRQTRKKKPKPPTVSSPRAVLGGRDVRKTTKQTRRIAGKGKAPKVLVHEPKHPPSYKRFKAQSAGFEGKGAVKQYHQLLARGPAVVKGPIQKAEPKFENPLIEYLRDQGLAKTGEQLETETLVERGHELGYRTTGTDVVDAITGTHPRATVGEKLLTIGLTLAPVGKVASAARGVKAAVGVAKEAPELAATTQAALNTAARLTRAERGLKATKAVAPVAKAAPKVVKRTPKPRGLHAPPKPSSVARARAGVRRAGTPSEIATRAAARGAARRAGGKRLVLKPKGGKARPLPLGAGLDPITLSTVGGSAGAGIGAAAIEGHITADPTKAVPTTLRAIPGIVTFPITVASDTGKTFVRAAQNVAAKAQGKPPPYSHEEVVAPLTGTATEPGLVDEVEAGLIEPLQTLASGDPEKVRELVESEVGYSFLVPVPAITRLKAWGKARAAIQSTAAKARRGAAAKVATKTGRPSNIRHAPAGVEQGAFGFTERRRTRKRVAQQASRTTRPQEVAATREAMTVLKPLRKAKQTRSLRNVTGREAGDAVGLIAEHGVSRDPARARSQLAQIKATLPEGEIPAGSVNDRVAIEFLEAHPEVLTNKHFWQAVDAYKASAAKIETSPRAKHMSQGDVFGITRPEDRVPTPARELTTAATRTEAWRALKQMEQQAVKLKGQARAAATRALEATGPRRAQLRKNAVETRAEAKHLEAQAHELRKALRRYTHPDQRLTTTAKRRKWDRPMLDEYVGEVRAEAQRQGFEEPAWTHHEMLSQQHLGAVAPSHPVTSTRVQHVRRGSSIDQVDRSLRALVSGSVYTPRLRRGGTDFARQFVKAESLPVEINGKSRRVVTQEMFDQAIREGQYDPKHFAFFPARQFQQAINDPAVSTTGFADFAQQLKEGERFPGQKGVIVRREAALEFAGQINPTVGLMENVLNKFAKGSSRILLGLSPGWAVAQIVAEGLPVLIAKNPVRLLRASAALRQMNKTTPDEAVGWAGVAGETPAILSSPSDLRLKLDGDAAWHSSNFLRAVERNPAGRALVSVGTARPLGMFDRWKGGKYRSVLMAAEADRRINGFVNGIGGIVREGTRLSEELKGRPLHEQLAIIEGRPEVMARLESYLDDIQGNWQAFTRFERGFAPALIFYPFLRYSLRWMFWSFPKRHPVKATILHLLAQQNADELEKLLGAPPARWTDYGTAISHSATGMSVLPGAARAAPGLNAIVESIGNGNVAGVTRALNPALGLLVTGATGVDPLSGEQKAEDDVAKGLAVLNQLLAMPAPLRALGVDLKKTTSASEAFSNIDPNAKLRSVLMPFLPLSSERAALKNQLSQAFADAGEKPEFSDYFDAALAGDRATIERLKRQRAISRDAQKVLDQLIPSVPGEKKALERAGKLVYGSGGSSSGSAAPWKVTTTTSTDAPWKATSSSSGAAPWK